MQSCACGCRDVCVNRSIAFRFNTVQQLHALEQLLSVSYHVLTTCGEDGAFATQQLAAAGESLARQASETAPSAVVLQR
jgi:hypothetical protein